MKKTVVAIFEDDAVNRFIYEQIFRANGDRATLYVFDRPESGLELSQIVEFDVVFIESHFWENFGGIGILQRLKRVALGQPVYISMSALLQPGDLERLMTAGFTMCMEKPIVFSESLFQPS